MTEEKNDQNTRLDRFKKTGIGKLVFWIAGAVVLVVAVGSHIEKIGEWISPHLPQEIETLHEYSVAGHTVYFSHGKADDYDTAVGFTDPKYHDVAIAAEYAWIKHYLPDAEWKEKYLVAEYKSLYLAPTSEGLISISDPDEIQKIDPKGLHTQVITNYYDIFIVTNKTGGKAAIYFDVSNLMGLPFAFDEDARFRVMMEHADKALIQSPNLNILVDELFYLRENQELLNYMRYENFR